MIVRELIDFLYESNVHSDLSIEDLAEEIDKMSVRRGRWEAVDWANEYFKCSECGRIERWSPNYCATCGSKMATRTLYVRGMPNIIEEPNC